MYTNEQITKGTTATKWHWPKRCRLVHTRTKRRKQKVINNLLNQNGLARRLVLVAACGGRPRVPHTHTLTFRVRQGATLSLCWTNKPAVDEQAQTAGMVIEPCLTEKTGRRVVLRSGTKQNAVLDENKMSRLVFARKKKKKDILSLSFFQRKRSWMRSSTLQVRTSFHGTLGMVPVLVCDFPASDTRAV